MGCYSKAIAEIKDKLTGKWIKVDKQFSDFDIKQGGQIVYKKTDKPFFWQDYDMFAFLADVRNRCGLTPLCQPKGFPKDSEYLNGPGYDQGGFGGGDPDPKSTDILSDGSFGHTWYLLRELLEFDYNKTFIDKSDENKPTTYRQVLGDRFFEELETLKKLGEPDDVRIIIWFD